MFVILKVTFKSTSITDGTTYAFIPSHKPAAQKESSTDLKFLNNQLQMLISIQIESEQ